MLVASLVSTDEELEQIQKLNKKNLKQYISKEEQQEQGFVTWLYTIDLLKQMQQQAPSVIVKDGERVVGYALTALKESRTFHPDLDTFFIHLENIIYRNKPLGLHDFYCMGQICIDKEYRGSGVFQLLYQKHKEAYSPSFDFLLTEISTSNLRSLKAHQNIGFISIYSYADAMDEWNVVVWPWK